MAGLRRYFCLQLLAFLLSNCLSEFGSNAQLIPQDEVDTLQLISNKMKNTYWKNVNQNSCNDGGDSFNQTLITNTSFSSVICDCSFNQSSVCHVVNITMKGLSLSGVLPAEFGNLSYLRVIDLSRNYLSGVIPVSLTKIPLVTLGLLGNRITGPIPDEIGQIATLMYLGLEDNELNGTLPQSLGNLKLTNLVLSGNNFVGRIPESFSKLKNLTELRINGNNFSGKIPDFLGNWTKLGILELLGTSMEGPIPPSISLLTNLTRLRISDLINTTSTVIPNLTGMTNLSELVLRNCLLTGNIPGFIPNLSKLKQVDLSYNQLTGQVPDSMQNLGSLQYLFLTNNSLSGTLPNWILNSKHYFDVSYNNFSGSTPTSCQISSNVNLVSSYSSTKGNSVNWCLKKDLPCTNPQYDSLFINCGGQSMNFDDHEYEENSSNQGPSTFFAVQEKWAYSSTGAFLYNDSVNFVAQETSNPNITGIYQTARQAPISLKYYGLCMLRGNYTVKLHFAEIMFSDDVAFSGDGRRIFDVAIQGKVVLKDFNIAARAGGAGKITVAEFNHIFVDGTLEIFLYWAGKGTTSIPTRSTYGPLISGISVTSEFKTGSGLSPGAIVGIVVASCVILVSVLLILRKKGYLGGKVHENEEFQGLETGYFTLRQIKAATDDFSHENKVGEGGFGPVYKGTLSDGRVIAVKQLSSKSKQGNREFLNEIGMISALQHPNLVKLYGCCIDKKELLLVYEYMENNSLARALFGEKDQQLHLDWQTRKAICLGIARGLAYLHEESRLKIVHRDIKATNVLLDKDLNAKISDFGLAKLDEEENTHISTRIAGTIGYMAPEYAMRGYLTDKADVYSFGVVLLEIVSGKSNTKYRPKEDFVYLLDWAYVLHEQGNLLELVDPNLGSSYSEEEALSLLNLALLCTNPSPTLRPAMSSVVRMIDNQLSIQAPIVKGNIFGDESSLNSLNTISQDTQDCPSSSPFSNQVQSNISTMERPSMSASIYVSAGQ